MKFTKEDFIEKATKGLEETRSIDVKAVKEFCERHSEEKPPNKEKQ